MEGIVHFICIKEEDRLLPSPDGLPFSNDCEEDTELILDMSKVIFIEGLKWHHLGWVEVVLVLDGGFKLKVYLENKTSYDKLINFSKHTNPLCKIRTYVIRYNRY